MVAQISATCSQDLCTLLAAKVDRRLGIKFGAQNHVLDLHGVSAAARTHARPIGKKRNSHLIEAVDVAPHAGGRHWSRARICAQNRAVGPYDRALEWFHLFFVGLKTGSIGIKFHFAAKPGIVHETAQFLPDIERLLRRGDPNIEIDRALLHGLGNLPGNAAADCPNVDPWLNDSADTLVTMLVFIFRRPLFDVLNKFRHSHDGAGVFFNRRRTRDVGRVNRTVISENSDLEERLACFPADDPEVGALCHKRIIGDAAMGDGVARASLLRDVLRRLKFVDGFDADLADDGHQHKIALELYAAVLDRFCRKQPGGHRPLVVDDSIAYQHVVFTPGAVKDRVAGVSRRPPLLVVDGGIHVTVETEAAAVAGAWKRRQYVGAIRIQTDLPRIEALAVKPVLHIVGDRSLASGRAIDIAEVERDLDEFVPINPGEDALQINIHRRAFASLGPQDPTSA